MENEKFKNNKKRLKLRGTDRRKSKNKSMNARKKKDKQSKKKAQLSSKYQENEREVSLLLENRIKSEDQPSMSEEFFCGSFNSNMPSTDECDVKCKRGEKGKDNLSRGPDKEEGRYTLLELLNTPGGTQNSLVSLSVQLSEDQLSDVVQVELEKFYVLNNNFLYKPKADVDCMLNLFSKNNLKNYRLMLERYKTESKANNFLLCSDVVKFFEKPTEKKVHFKHPSSRNADLTREFKPIFIKPTREPIFIPCQKLFTVYIKDVRFSEHPELTEEHYLSNHLETLYENYHQRLLENITEKLNADLQIERNILNDLLDSTTEDMLCNDADKVRKASRIEHLSRKVKALREKLYNEEATSKQLLKDILDNWLQLKKLRQEQQQQFTRFQLLIKVEEISVNEIKARKKLWLKRYETDLNEIYREHLEEYYYLKRLWQQQCRQNSQLTRAKPRKPKLSKLKEELKITHACSFLHPNEPRINIIRYLTEEQEFARLCGPGKLQSYFLRIFLDQVVVGETRSYRLERDFRININEVIGIVIDRHLPKSICVKLYKKHKATSNKKIANIMVPLTLHPDIKKNQTISINFSSDKSPISGMLHLSIHFDKGTNIYECDVPKAVNRKYSNNSKLNDLNKNDDEENITPMADACTFEEYLLHFCDVKELFNNKRWNLLQSRYLKDDARTRDLKCVPMLEHELQLEWEETEKVLDVGNLMDPIDLHKHNARKYLRSLYTSLQNHIMQLYNGGKKQGYVLVNDEPSIWKSFLQAIRSIFQPAVNINLNNSHESNFNIRKSTDDDACNITIVCNIKRATGIPVKTTDNHSDDIQRKTKQFDKASNANTFVMQSLKYTNVKPFVALNYRNLFARTMTAEGSNPTWNEKLMLHIDGSLSDLKEDITLSLFDEVVESHYIDDNDNVKNVDVYQRIQNNWLGSLRIPISALLREHKFEGVFELYTPLILLGYKSASLCTDTNITIDPCPEVKECVRLWCSISIEPQYELPSINTKVMDCMEVMGMENYLNFWYLEAQRVQSKNFQYPLVCTSEGKRICMTRLLQPLKPPMESDENMIARICRFVSLLGVTEFYNPCISLDGIWLKNEILLDTTYGSCKDIGVLLCNYLLYMNLKCWLVLGLSLYQGECTFVLYKAAETSELSFIDPCSGRSYALNDVFCPLKEIYVGINTNNIYLNLQTTLRVSMMNFNFNDSSCWLPVFDKKHKAPLGGFHNDNYSYHSSMSTHDLRLNIERKIVKKINSWRVLRKTTWNRAIQSRLMSILQNLEHMATLSDSAIGDINLKYNNTLKSEFPNYKIFGFTLNFPYTNLNHISERIKNTGLHLNTNRNVEFSVAVHIHPYANNVLSVWIFLVSIVTTLGDTELNENQ